MTTPLLGWIPPRDRTPEQNNAHAAAMRIVRAGHGLQAVSLAPGEKLMLTDSWKDPSVVAELGFVFTGFRQLTGSCVGVSEGNWITTLACIQSKLTVGAHKPFVCFWPFPYGRTRYNEGDRGQGEGAIDSVMGEVISREGYFDIAQPGLPQFNTSDGFALTSNQELQWSDGGSALVTKWASLAAQHVGAKATCNSTDDIWNAIGNGYPVIDGCDNYIGNGSIVGTGADAYVRGHYDGRGGHSTCILGIWQHPNDGRLFLYSNQWSGSTYPKDPAGAGRCCVWTTEAEMHKLFQTGGNGGETMALSHVDWFPAQPKILDTYI
jgi:hypothetical protein